MISLRISPCSFSNFAILSSVKASNLVTLSSLLGSIAEIACSNSWTASLARFMIIPSGSAINCCSTCMAVICIFCLVAAQSVLFLTNLIAILSAPCNFSSYPAFCSFRLLIMLSIVPNISLVSWWSRKKCAVLAKRFNASSILSKLEISLSSAR